MLALLCALSLLPSQPAAPSGRAGSLFGRDNLVAWCVVPFDARKRTPPERVAMLQSAGVRKLAWDWRDEHLARMDEEFGLLRKSNIELSAVWFPAALPGPGEKILQAAAKHRHTPQLWVSLGDPAPGKDQAAKVRAAAAVLAPIAIAGNKQGCKLALYNHGGWFGEPENQVHVLSALKQSTGIDAGIVYNLHHGHDHLARLAPMLKAIRPHLLCVNLNGMDTDGDKFGRKILQMGQGARDLECLRAILDSGYTGPIGVLGHTEHDAELTLRDNLDGLAWLNRKLAGGDAGPAPRPRTPVPARIEPKPPSPPGDPGWLAEGRPEYRDPPITAEARAKMGDASNFRILLASETKNSPTHWELFTAPGKGTLSVFMPGRKPDHLHSDKVVADGGEHTVGLVLTENEVELWVDGAQVAKGPVKGAGLKSLEGNLGLGRLAEGGLDTGGTLRWARLRSGRHAPHQAIAVPVADGSTLGLWDFTKPPAGNAHPDGSRLANPARRVIDPKPLGKPPIGFDPEVQKNLLALSLEKGNAERGAALFSSAKQACLSCHKVGEAGGKVGPELTLLATCQPPEAIVEAVLWPNRTVRPEYRAWQVATAEGKVLQGYLDSGAPGKTRLRDSATGKIVEIADSEIEDKKEIGSLMPGGVIESLGDQDRADLVRFLLDLGKDPSAARRVAEHASFSHKAEAFPFGREPIDTQSNPLWNAFPNRERLYDFYSKEARHFAGQSKRPAVVQAFPGLDQGKHGHWGNQNEDTWKSAEWTKADLGRVLAGVFRSSRPRPEGTWVPVIREASLLAFRSAIGLKTNPRDLATALSESGRRRAQQQVQVPPGDLEVIRGVCVRLGNKGELAACFNPETLAYEAVWKGGFLTLGTIRHGFMDGLKPAGPMLPLQPNAGPVARLDPSGSRYLGYYRHGDRIVFHYILNGVEYLDSPWAENGAFRREVAPRASSPLEPLTRGGGKPRWPERLERAILQGTGTPYAIDTFETPHKNPWNSPFFPGDVAHLPGGSSLVCTMQGDVWRVDNVTRVTGTVTWRKVASGLHQALGMVVHEGVPYVLGRDQITRLDDLDGDGEYDHHACHSMAFKPSAGGHDFICGLERAPDGSFLLASSNQGVVRVSPDGQSAEVLATGFRNPDGIGLAPDGRVTIPCSEGEWTPSSMICEIKKGGFYGYTGPKNGATPDLPLVYLPRGLDNSAGGQVAVPDDRWGPLAGRMIHFSFGACTHHLLLRDEIDGQAQGAVVPLPGEFRSGAHRGRFHPADGQLYVAGMQGWGSYAVDDGCLQRVRHTGAPVQLPLEYKAHANGVMLRFSLPVDRELLSLPQSSLALAWNYRYGPAYGSPEFSSRHFGLKGHDILAIRRVHVLGDGRTVFVEIPDLQPVNTLHLHLRVSPACPVDLFATVHKLAPDFTLLADYQARSKVLQPHPILADLALAGKTVPNRWRHPLPGAKPLEVKAGPNLSFVPGELRAKAGENLAITFTNPDVVPHNWALITPGSLPKVGDLANRLISDPDAAARHYIPDSPEVIAHSDVVSPGEKFTIYIKSPPKGRYPFVCTFPGHWMVMNGVLVVE